jgi:hypothetical protein
MGTFGGYLAGADFASNKIIGAIVFSVMGWAIFSVLDWLFGITQLDGQDGSRPLDPPASVR